MAIQYFPGTNIARMNTKAGIRARTFGTKEVMNNLNKKLLQIKAGSMAGLVAAGAHIYKDMDDTPYPKIPVDTGTLRESFKMIPDTSDPTKAKLEIGWPDAVLVRNGKTVDQYAAYVHEMTSPPYGAVNWSRPGSGPKFFESAIKRNTDKIVDIVKLHVKSNTGI